MIRAICMICAIAGICGICASPAPAQAPPPTPVPAEAPPLPSAIQEDMDRWADFGAAAFKMIAAIGVMAAAGAICVKLLGPRLAATRARDDDLIKVLEAKRLDLKTTLYLVEIAGAPTLIGVSENEVRGLAPLEIDGERVREALARRAAREAPAPAGKFVRVLARKAQVQKPEA
jgi:flagellar biogenesis protein FliO